MGPDGTRGLGPVRAAGLRQLEVKVRREQGRAEETSRGIGRALAASRDLGLGAPDQPEHARQFQWRDAFALVNAKRPLFFLVAVAVLEPVRRRQRGRWAGASQGGFRQQLAQWIAPTANDAGFLERPSRRSIQEQKKQRGGLFPVAGVTVPGRSGQVVLGREFDAAQQPSLMHRLRQVQAFRRREPGHDLGQVRHGVVLEGLHELLLACQTGRGQLQRAEELAQDISVQFLQRGVQAFHASDADRFGAPWQGRRWVERGRERRSRGAGLASLAWPAANRRVRSGAMTNGHAFQPQNPLIVQGDHTVLVEVDNPRYAEARDALGRFAELVKSPEHVHTYRLTPLSIWNACAVGENAESIVAALCGLSKYTVPSHVRASVRDFAGRYGALQLRREAPQLVLRARDLPLAEELAHQPTLTSLLRERRAPIEFVVAPPDRGRLKQALIKLGFPTEDLAGYQPGESLDLALRSVTSTGRTFAPRDYQREAADLFHAGGAERGGSGVVVLPCGAGKTIVGTVCMALLRSSTLILTTGITAARQWKAELLDKTNLSEDLIGEYSGDSKEVRPVTISTYQILTHRKNKSSDFTHFALFDQRNWGLIIYDEVHLLPAPVFQVTASLQARRRLGLTATLVREDGLEDEVFALIGP